MADNDLELRFSIANEDAVEAVDQVNKALDDTTAAAGAATSAAQGVGAALVDGTAAAAPALDAVTQASNTANAAFDKLGQAQGVRGLSRSIVEAQVAMQAFQRAAADGGAAGEKMLAGVGASVQAMQAQIVAATQKLGDFRKAQADIGAQAAIAGSQLDALRMRAGSLMSMFDGMERTGTGATKMVGALGVGVGIGVMAFDAAVAAGEKVSKMLVGLVDAYAAHDEKVQQAANMENLDRIALDEVAKGHVELGKNLRETIQNYDLFAVASGKSSQLAKQFADDLQKIKPPQNMAEATRDIQEFAAGLEGAMKKGPEDAALFLASQKKVVDTLIAYYTTIGQRVPQELQNIVTTQKQATAAQKLLSEEGARSAIESYAAILDAQKSADLAADQSVAHAQGIFEARMKMLNQENLTAEEYSKKKEALYAEDAAAQDVAAAQQALADAKAELAAAELQKKMDLSAMVFKDVSNAATNYAADVARGVPPSEALASATGKLQETIEKTKEAVPQLNDNLETLWKQADSLGERLGKTGTAAEGFHKQVADAHGEVQKLNDRLTTTGVLLQMLADKLPVTGTWITDFKSKIEELGNSVNATQTAFDGGGQAP